MNKSKKMHLEIRKQGTKVYGVIRSSFREGGKVLHHTHGWLTGMKRKELELIQTAFRGDVVVKGGRDAFQVTESKEYGASAALLALAKAIGLDRTLYSRPAPWVSDAMAMIVGRIVYAGSKLSLSHQWKNTALWELCGVDGAVDVDKHCYAAMDRLLERQAAIEKTLAAKYLKNSRLVLYDITSSYFEGEYAESEIVTFGYNRDGKRHHEQMVVALVCNEDGCPVGVEVFPGNTQDASTVPAKIAQIQRDYGVKELLFVGDRGMVTQANVEKVKDVEGLTLISALTHRQILDLMERRVVQAELFDECNVVEVIDPENPARRYALCRNPASTQRETNTRNRLLEITKKKLQEIATSKRRHSAQGIGERVGRILQQYKMGKFVEWSVQDGRLQWQIREDRVLTEAVLDGCYVIVSNVAEEKLNAAELVESYKRLRFVETAFRNLKTVQLEMRPVYHKTDDRIKAHVFLCMLAYHLQWHAMQRLQPLFDGDGQGKERQWTFASVIQRLMCVRRDKVSVDGMMFSQTTIPEPDHVRILELLGVTV